MKPQTTFLLSAHAVPTDCAVHKDRTRNSETPWWLWWHLLSLDAPTVSLVWAVLFARCYGVRLALNEVVISCLAVWIIYVGDRLLDGWRAPDPEALRQRHFFYAQHRSPVICLGVLAVFINLWLISSLAPGELLAGLKLGAIVILYLLSVHLSPRIARLLPKELAVGILFAGGTALPIWSRSRASSGDWEFSVGLFALLCTLNCYAIDCWERNASNLIHHRGTEQNLRRKVFISEAAVGLAVAGLALLSFDVTDRNLTAVAFAVSLSASLIFCLNNFRGRLSLSALRVIVDLILVMAALVALIIRI